MSFVRSIGRWGFAGLVINSVIGSGVFGTPGELARILGTASPWVVLLAALAMAVFMACFVEVAAQFSETGGAYLYVRSAFGRFAGLLVAWFGMLAPLGAAAAQVNLFANYLSQWVPGAGVGWGRGLVAAALIASVVIANLLGARTGKNLSGWLASFKLVPLLLLIVIGWAHFGNAAIAAAAPFDLPQSFPAWSMGFMLAAFSFGGFEDPLVPSAEVVDPGRTIRFGYLVSLLACGFVYMALQFVVVAAVGASPTDHPLSATGSVLLGPRGAELVAVAAMVSTYGSIAAIVLIVPRLLFSLSRHGELPAFLSRMNSQHHTPAAAIATVGGLIFVLALTGTFLWALAVCAGAMMIVYGAVCAALLQLRRTRPDADNFRIPLGRTCAVLGVLISIFLLAQLRGSQIALMGLTVLVAAINWVLTPRRSEASVLPLR
jgi:amino acid transporter